MIVLCSLLLPKLSKNEIIGNNFKDAFCILFSIFLDKEDTESLYENVM